MTQELVAYSWECPICSATKRGLSTVPTVSVKDQAKNALISHVRTKKGRGHGRSGAFPPGFSADAVMDFIEFEGEAGESTRSPPGVEPTGR